MILPNVYSTLILIIAISLFVNVNAEDAKRSNAVQNIINTLQKDCNIVENLPERVCKTTIEALESETKKACQKATQLVCDVLPWFIRIILSKETCKRDLDEYLCRTLEKVERVVMGRVENECIEELEKIFIGHGCDADGNKVSLCDGLPTTVDGICTVVVDAVCEQLPSVLHTFTPFCQETFDGLICNDVVGAIASKVPTTPPISYHLSLGQAVGLP